MQKKENFNDIKKSTTVMLPITAFVLVLCLFGVLRLYSPLEGSVADRYLMIVVNLFSWLSFLFLAYVFSGRCNWRHAFLIVFFSLAFVSFSLFGFAKSDLMGLYPAIFMTFSYIGLFSIIYFFYQLIKNKNNEENNNVIVKILLFAVPMSLLSFAPFKILSLTVLLNPYSFDLNAYYFDASLGFQISQHLSAFVVMLGGEKTIKKFFEIIYFLVPFFYPILYGLSIKHEEKVKSDLMFSWALSILVIVFSYNFVPVAGPRFSFGDNFLFNMNMDGISQSPSANGNLLAAAVARNGVPSLHFGWALIFWLYSVQMGVKWLRNVCAVFLGLTFIAVFVLGQHFLVDLVVSVPVVTAIFSITLRIGDKKLKQKIFFLNFSLALAWMIFIRYGAGVAINIPILIPILEAMTVVFSAICYRRMVRSGTSVESVYPTPEYSTYLIKDAINATKLKIKSMSFIVVMVFVLSGFSGLVYEVVFSKLLANVFGSTGLANFIVLASYMGGMAIGAWLGGIVANRIKNPLLTYAVCEIIVGLYFLITPVIVSFAYYLYVKYASNILPDEVSLIYLRIAIGALILLVPTILMGATLPLLIKHLNKKNNSIGLSVSTLYAANTFGAAFGAFLAGYLLIPSFGLNKTILLSVVINMLVALIVFNAYKKSLIVKTQEATVDDYKSDLHIDGTMKIGHGILAMLILFVGGALTIALEINYTHLLAIVAGNSTYAFSLMLATFLLGLASGSIFSNRLMRCNMSPLSIVFLLEVALCCSLLMGVFSWDSIAQRFENYSDFPVYLLDKEALTINFSQREFVRGVACVIAMFPAAFFIGAIYPLLLDVVGKSFKNNISMTGFAISLNTLGNIFGVVLGAFYLLPKLGSFTTIHVLAYMSLAMALIIIPFLDVKAKRLSVIFIAASLLLFYFQPHSFNYTKLASGANVYFANQDFGDVIDHTESIDGGLTAVHLSKVDPNLKVLTTNAKFQGNNSLSGEMIPQIAFGVIPMLYNKARDDALVIGYGTGVTSRVFHQAGFKNLDIAELSQDVVTMADKYFSNVNNGVSKQSGVKTYITDGRNLLLLQNKRYDIISMEITSIWFAGAASLYNKEFYQLAKARLKPGGVLQQWVQLHHMRGEDFLTIIATLRSEFKNVWLFTLGGQGIVIATDEERTQDYTDEALKGLMSTPALSPLLAILGDEKNIKNSLLLNPSEIDHYISSTAVTANKLISTDNNLWLEYGTPKGNAIVGDSRKVLLDQLLKFKTDQVVAK